MGWSVCWPRHMITAYKYQEQKLAIPVQNDNLLDFDFLIYIRMTVHES